MRNSGLLAERTILNEKNRKLALGVSLNWGLRFLLAYALEATESPPTDPQCMDLAWIREKVATLVRGHTAT